MPFDNMPNVTLADIAGLLRDESRWPMNFEWDYSTVHFCALGLMRRVHPYRYRVNMTWIHEIRAELNLSAVAFAYLFYCPYGEISMGLVTPGMVASRIERWLKDGTIPASSFEEARALAGR